MREDAQQIARDALEYDRLGKKYGYISLNTGDIGNFFAYDLRSRIKAAYSGMATRCVVAGVCHPRIGIGMAHFNTVTRDRLIRRGLKDIEMNLALAQARHRVLVNDERELVRTIVTREDTEETALAAIRAAADSYTQLCDGDIPMGSRLLICGAFHLVREDVPVVEACVRDYATGIGIDPRHIVSRIGSATGVMFGFPGHHNFPGIGFYDMRQFKKLPR